MMRDWITDQGLLLGPAFALVLFVAIFVFILFWIFRPGSDRFYENSARMPLDEVELSANKKTTTT